MLLIGYSVNLVDVLAAALHPEPANLSGDPYENIENPNDKPKSRPDATKYLRLGMTFEILGELAHELSDTESTNRMKTAGQKPLNTIGVQTPDAG